ncbi:MAG: class I SAM-dependent methyltransferase [Acidobacteriota bacterium]
MTPIITTQSDNRDRRHELLPAELLPLFNETFVESCDLIERFTVALTLQVLQRCDLEVKFAAGATLSEAMTHAQLKPEVAEPALRWMLRLLCAHDQADDDRRGDLTHYRLRNDRQRDDIPRLRELQAALDPTALPAYRIAEIAAEGYPEFLRGEKRGDELLFRAETFDAWPEYFSNHNPLYAINNRVAAAAVLHWQRGPIGRVLELGGGMGSAALALVAALDSAQRSDTLSSYLFSELSPVFLRRGQRALTAALPSAASALFRRLDIDLPLAPQGIEKDSVDLVYAVNVLHVARDLDATLAQLYQVIAPGGWLVLGECVRPHRDSAVYTEFVFQLLDSFRAPVLDPIARPNAGFLCAQDWQRLLLRHGFERAETYPDLHELSVAYPAFVVGAIGAQRPSR